MRRPTIVTITPWSSQAVGAGIAASSSTALQSAASATYPSANLAIFIPFSLEGPLVVTQMFCVNGGTTGGSIDVGIYTEDGRALRAKGSTTQTGAGAYQFFNIDDIVLGPGQFYMAVAMDISAGTPTLLRGTWAGAVQIGAFCGMAEQATAFPLPMTATLATYATANYIPLIGLTGRATI